MYNGVEFVGENTLDGEWLLEVRIHGVVVGYIRQRSEKTYCYYRRTWSDGAPFHEEEELEVLLQRVAERP